MLALVPPDFADPGADYQAVRSMLGPFHGHPVPEHVAVEEAVLGGVRAAWYTDTREPPGAAVAFHCHGGGLVSCPLDDYHFYGAMLAGQLGLRVVMPDYRLAPEHPYPAAHQDCLAAYRALLESGQDPGRLVVMGDSCGGGLALSTLVAARVEGLALPAGYVSLSGWFDLSVARPVARGPDPFLTAGWVRHRGRDYTAGRVSLSDPRVSPAYADLAGLPPLYLPVAQFDTVGDGVDRVAAAARRSGVDVTYESWPGAVHGWQGLVSVGVPEAVAAFGRTRAFVAWATAADRSPRERRWF
jgi:monoterpene epsilon-lactone hydrolase